MHICPIKYVVERKKSYTVEHIHYNSNGEERTVEVNAYPIFDDKGKVVQVIEYSIDITDKRRSDRAILEKEHRFRSLIETSPDAIIITNLNGNN